MYRRLVRKKKDYRRSVDTETSIMAFTGFSSRCPMVERFYSKRFVVWLLKRYKKKSMLAEQRELRAKTKLHFIEMVLKGKFSGIRKV